MGSSDVRNVRVEEKSPSSHYPNTGSPGLVAPTVPFSVESIALLLHNLWIWSVAGLGMAIKRYRQIYKAGRESAIMDIVSRVSWIEYRIFDEHCLVLEN